ncbi:MAG TPA: nitrate reductase cytochrome c-type subunit [Burkholderiaceae bacterium]|nr:nitrate reductase cytochrome c-type subunit [Burkholderiaceae bacterium]
MARRVIAAAVLSVGLLGPAVPAPFVDPMRGPTAIDRETMPPRLTNTVNDDQRLKRNYADQPPVIPHRVDGYQVDRNFNKCLDCHARAKTAFSQAVPVSSTHYIDRDGKLLDHVSTRRYFCQQCHVAQEPMRPLVGNRFRGDDTLPPAAK